MHSLTKSLNLLLAKMPLSRFGRGDGPCDGLSFTLRGVVLGVDSLTGGGSLSGDELEDFARVVSKASVEPGVFMCC